METIKVSLGTLKSWFGKNDSELVEALFNDKDGEKSPKEQSVIDSYLNDLLTDSIKSFERKYRDEGHKRGNKEALDKVESRLRELGVEAENWEQGIEKLSKIEKVKVDDVSDDLVKSHKLYKDLLLEINKERDAHKESILKFEQEKTNEKVKDFFKGFLSSSDFEIPAGETEEEKAIRENWENMFIERAIKSANWKLAEDGKPVAVDENGEALLVDYKPVSASQIAERTASSMFRKVQGQKRGESSQSVGTKIFTLNDNTKFSLPKVKNDEEFLSALNKLKEDKNIPLEAIDAFVESYEKSE